MATQNFYVHQGKRKSQRRSSILKSTRAKPFDEIQNTSHDDRTKDRRVSFSRKIEIKEFVKDSNATNSKREKEEECGAKVQISTPKADHSRCTDRLSIVDRLSIIPKLDRSFVNDSEDFEPYTDDSPLVNSLPVEGVVSPAQAPELHDQSNARVAGDSQTPSASPSVSNPHLSLARSPSAGSQANPISSTNTATSSTNPPITAASPIQQSVTFTASPIQQPAMLTTPHCNQSDMELTLNESSPFLVVPEITSIKASQANNCTSESPSRANRGRESVAAAMSFTMVDTRNSSKSESPGRSRNTVVDKTAPMSFTMVDTRNSSKSESSRNTVEPMSFTMVDARNSSKRESPGRSRNTVVDKTAPMSFTMVDTRKSSKRESPGRSMTAPVSFTMVADQASSLDDIMEIDVESFCAEEKRRSISLVDGDGAGSEMVVTTLIDSNDVPEVVEDDNMVMTLNKTIRDGSVLDGCGNDDDNMVVTLNRTGNVSVFEDSDGNMAMTPSQQSPKSQVLGKDDDMATTLVTENGNDDALSKSTDATLALGGNGNGMELTLNNHVFEVASSGKTDSLAAVNVTEDTCIDNPCAVVVTGVGPSTPFSTALTMATLTAPSSIAAETSSANKPPLASTRKKQQKSPRMVHVPHDITVRGVPTVAVSTPLNKRSGIVSRHAHGIFSSCRGTSSRVMRTMVSSALSRQRDLNQTCDMEMTGIFVTKEPSQAGLTGTPLYPKRANINQTRCKVVLTPRATPINPRDHTTKQDQLETSHSLEVVSSLSNTGSSATSTSMSSGSDVSAPTASMKRGSMSDGGGGPVLEKPHTLTNGAAVDGDEGNWLQANGNSILLVSNSDTLSPAPAEATLTSPARKKSSPARKKSSPARAGKKRKSLTKKKQNSLRASLLQELKSKTQEGNESVEICTPELVVVEHREVVSPAQNSIFPSPNATVVDEVYRNRQSLMVSPSGFTKFLVNLNCDKTLGDQTISQDMLSSAGACVDQGGQVSPAASQNEIVVCEGEVLEKHDSTFTVQKGVEEMDLTAPASAAAPLCRERESHSVHGASPQGNTLLLETSTHPFTMPPPELMSSDPCPSNSAVSTPPPSESPVVVSPPRSPVILSLLEVSRSVSSCIPLHSISSQSLPSGSGEDIGAGGREEKAGNFDTSTLIQTNLTGGETFIMHVHSLRARYLAIAHSCQIRLSISDYLHKNGHDLFQPLLESIITRANLGLSVLTLFISYGDVSGTAREKGPIPSVSEVSISEATKEEKYMWMEGMHNEIEQKYSDIEATMVSAAELFHWQVDCWSRSKVEITIHNSAKIALTLEDSPVCTYPQRIKRTNVRYGRGSLLFSKPQTEACTSTADIAQLLWTIIRYRGNS